MTGSPWRAAAAGHRAGSGRARHDARARPPIARARTGDTHVWDLDQEPDLDSLLADPLVGLVMVRDGLSPDDVAQYVRRARERLAAASA
ncbi:hypothetical protein F1188_01060 [Roseospira marina]|uniref:Uncharacterized protein n=2 Tax=Roseospira marina TaxID=140057 RepID=A0A5M6IGE6_9PROT|nr:hypothetical protein F1188_01060 [Roseospira marina]